MKFDTYRMGHFRARAFQLVVLACSLFVALAIPVIYGAENTSLRQMMALGTISTMAVVLGEAIRVAVGRLLMSSLDDCAGMVMGFSVLCMIHLIATMGLNVGAGTAIWVDGLVCFISIWFVYRKTTNNSSPNPGLGSWKDVFIQCLLLVVLSLLTTFWGREALQSVIEAKQSGVFRVWNDFLFQATEIGYQINYPAFRNESAYLADQPQVFYHRASYSHAAIYGWISGDPLIGVATYYWLPAGILMMGLGAYAMGHAIGGRTAGAASALALFLLPDASMYGLKNGYFAFYWLIHVAPGSGYAIGLCLVALAYYFAGQRQSGGLRYLLVGLVIALAGSMFRIHVAIPVVIVLVALLVFKLRERTTVRPLIFFAAIAGSGLCIVLGFESISMAPHFISGKTHGLFYIEAVHLASPTAYEGVFNQVTKAWGDWSKGASGYLLLLVAQHGLVVPLLLVVLWKSPVSALRKPLAQMALAMLLVHAAITFLIPTPGNGDITEWSHRSFVVIHAVLTVLLVTSSLNAIQQLGGSAHQVLQMNRQTQLAVGFAAMALIAVPWHFGKNLQYGTLKDGPSACATKISAEVFEAAQYIRAHSRATDRFFVSNADPDAVLTALTGLQAYVSRGMFFHRLGGSFRNAVVERMSDFAEVKREATMEALVVFGAKSGVRWVVVENKDWPTLNRGLLSQTVLLNQQFAVFDLNPAASASGRHLNK